MPWHVVLIATAGTSTALSSLQDGVHVVKLPGKHEGVDVEQFRTFTGGVGS